MWEGGWTAAREEKGRGGKATEEARRAGGQMGATYAMGIRVIIGLLTRRFSNVIRACPCVVLATLVSAAERPRAAINVNSGLPSLGPKSS